eukprot:1302222-Rhodomonas_salina.1
MMMMMMMMMMIEMMMMVRVVMMMMEMIMMMEMMMMVPVCGDDDNSDDSVMTTMVMTTTMAMMMRSVGCARYPGTWRTGKVLDEVRDAVLEVVVEQAKLLQAATPHAPRQNNNTKTTKISQTRTGNNKTTTNQSSRPSFGAPSCKHTRKYQCVNLSLTFLTVVWVERYLSAGHVSSSPRPAAVTLHEVRSNSLSPEVPGLGVPRIQRQETTCLHPPPKGQTVLKLQLFHM